MNKFLGIVKCVAIMVAFWIIQFAVSFAAGIVLAFFCALTKKDANTLTEMIKDNTLLIGELGQVIALIVFGLVYYFKCYKKEVKKTNEAINARNVIGICLLGFGLQFVINLIIGLIGMAFPKIVKQYVDMVEQSGMGKLGFLAILSTVVLAPLVEEIIFRGLIIRIGEKHFKKPIALVFLSASLFGIMHMIPLQVIYAFLLGLVIAGVYVKHRSLTLCILLHLVFNASAYISTFIQNNVRNKNEALGTLLLLSVPFVLSIIGAILVFKKDRNTLNDVDSYVLDKKNNEKKLDDFNNTVRINTDKYVSHNDR